MSWEPNLHPRDRKGQFRDVAAHMWKMADGQTMNLDDVVRGSQIKTAQATRNPRGGWRIQAQMNNLRTVDFQASDPGDMTKKLRALGNGEQMPKTMASEIVPPKPSRGTDAIPAHPGATVTHNSPDFIRVVGATNSRSWRNAWELHRDPKTNQWTASRFAFKAPNHEVHPTDGAPEQTSHIGPGLLHDVMQQMNKWDKTLGDTRMRIPEAAFPPPAGHDTIPGPTASGLVASIKQGHTGRGGSTSHVVHNKRGQVVGHIGSAMATSPNGKGGRQSDITYFVHRPDGAINWQIPTSNTLAGALDNLEKHRASKRKGSK